MPTRSERLPGALARRPFRHALVRPDRLDHLRVDAQHRVQRVHRILEDHGEAPAAQASAAPPPAGRRSSRALEHDRAGGDPSRRVDEAEDGKPGDRFAGAGFADEPQHLAAVEVEGDAVDGGQHALAGPERDDEIADREDGLAHRASLGLSTSRRRSPTRLMATIAMTSAMPGKVEIQYLPESR